MAENFTVIFNQHNAGYGPQIPFKNQTEAVGGSTPVNTARIAVVKAATAQEACTGVRRAFGDSMVTGKMEVVKTSSVEEKTA